jgi:hypothetical protein
MLPEQSVTSQPVKPGPERTVEEERGGVEEEDANVSPLDTGVEAGSGAGEADDVFKSMDAECKVCMQEIKVSRSVAYSVYDLYVD